MALKQDITVMNHFSAHGSRGKTSAKYLLRYVVRDGAMEVVEPIRRDDAQAFNLRYVVRADAIDSAPDVPEAKRRMWNAQRYGGTAFGYGELSLSDQALVRAARDQQALQDAGKTVMMAVVSFDQDYLERNGIVEPGFKPRAKGDYRGHIDQMKLRQAITNGMRRISSEFDDLRWTAGIQVDTMHVHCHMVLVDAGVGNLMPDGEQRGKIPQRVLTKLKRGIDASIDRNREVAFLSSAVGYERRNVTTYIKRWAHQQVVKQTLPQMLVACLPEDRSLWRAGSNRKEMAKPNAILRQVVEQSLERPGSPMDQAMEQVRMYARQRMLREELDEEYYESLVRRGRADIVDGSINAVYAQLRRVPESHLRVRTQLLEAVGAADDEQAGAERAQQAQLAGQAATRQAVDQLVDIAEFGRRLSSWSGRLAEHQERREQYLTLIQGWHQADIVGRADVASRAMLDMYATEEEYEAMCVSKYLHLMPLKATDRVRQEIWAPVAEHGERLEGLRALVADDSLRKLSNPEEAERRGVEAYGQHGGRLMAEGSAGRDVLRERVRRMEARQASMVHDAVAELANRGLLLADGVEPDDLLGASEPPAVVDGTEHDFEDVRGIDLHRLRFDYLEDEPVDPRVLQRAAEMAQRRSDAARAALDYLASTGQDELVELVPVDDIAEMVRAVQQVRDSGSVLPSEVARLRELEVARRSATLQLDDEMMPDLEQVVADSADEAVRAALADLERVREPGPQDVAELPGSPSAPGA